MNTNRITACAAGIVMLCMAGVASAKLPPPTAQEQAQAKEAAAKKAAAAAKQKQELAAVEDRIVAQYKEKHLAKDPVSAPARSAPAPAAATGTAQQ